MLWLISVLSSAANGLPLLQPVVEEHTFFGPRRWLLSQPLAYGEDSSLVGPEIVIINDDDVPKDKRPIDEHPIVQKFRRRKQGPFIRFGKRSSKPAMSDTHQWFDLRDTSLMTEAEGYSLPEAKHRRLPRLVRLHPRFLVMTV
ncbi:hypothetical protein AAVH_30815 [Aphelenchoides avenae]|nr:hypothetical protein AAVH_30815 [Aphelenchus avenae]